MTTEVPETPDLDGDLPSLQFVDDSMHSVYARDDSVQLKVGWGYIQLYKTNGMSSHLRNQQ